jgi:hypothetical protein
MGYLEGGVARGVPNFEHFFSQSKWKSEKGLLGRNFQLV